MTQQERIEAIKVLCDLLKTIKVDEFTISITEENYTLVTNKIIQLIKGLG